MQTKKPAQAPVSRPYIIGKSKPKIAMLMGGISAERDISLLSGQACAKALRALGYEIAEIDAGADLPFMLAKMRPDIVFNALHGQWGEDGIVQGIFEWMGLAYTHSGVLASALAMHKIQAKTVFRNAGLTVANGFTLRRDSFDPIASRPDYPYVVKPVLGGSSVDVMVVADIAQPVLSNIYAGGKGDELLMVEEYIPGHELTVSVLGARALGVTEIRVDAGQWYDYDAKYSPGKSFHILPAEIPPRIYEAARDYALRAHKALGCRGLTRSDFRWNPEKGLDGLVIIELNTQPGMTATSLSPEQAVHEGIDFAQLCEWIVKDATCAR